MRFLNIFLIFYRFLFRNINEIHSVEDRVLMILSRKVLWEKVKNRMLPALSKTIKLLYRPYYYFTNEICIIGN